VATNWRTFEFVAEGAVFLIMGWQVKRLLTDLDSSNETFALTLLVAAICWAVALATRGGFITIVVALADRSLARKEARRDRWYDRRQAFASWWPGSAPGNVPADGAPHPRSERWPDDVDPARVKHRFERLRTLVRRYSADVEYLIREPLHAREGVLLTWAGLRGVVTVAGAQTLPLNLPHRPLIVLAAFAVATFSLLAQGLTLAPVARSLDVIDHDQTPPDETGRLESDLRKAAIACLDDATRPSGQPFDPHLLAGFKSRLAAQESNEYSSSDEATRAQLIQLRLITLSAQRDEILRLRSLGTYATATLMRALNRLDAHEISLRLNLADED
jgi:CPA1 family monovalent cation:H+ antiporter